MTREDFIQELKRLRKYETFKTQKEIAESVGIGLSTYQQYEMGIHLPTLKNMRKILAYYADVENISILKLRNIYRELTSKQ